MRRSPKGLPGSRGPQGGPRATSVSYTHLDVYKRQLGADVVCFTGHKGLYGPQGTGGLAVAEGVDVPPLLEGGSGTHSFDERHPRFMPEALEAGTLNAHGLAGLAAGVALSLIHIFPWNASLSIWRYRQSGRLLQPASPRFARAATACGAGSKRRWSAVPQVRAMPCWQMCIRDRFYAEHFDNDYMQNRFQTMTMDVDDATRIGR